MINLSFDELRLIAQNRNISDYENKSKEDLIKALSEPKPETPNQDTKPKPETPKQDTKLKSKPEPQIRKPETKPKPKPETEIPKPENLEKILMNKDISFLKKK